MATILSRVPLSFVPFRHTNIQKKTHKIAVAKENVVYQGYYGPFTIDENDKREVFLYRTGLSICASSLALGTMISFFPEPPVALYNPLCFLGCAGFGLSLTQVHMYVSSIKRTVQFLWLLGALGAFYVAFNQPTSIPETVLTNPGYIWLVGPYFASMTGLTVKEGLCYGKLEAALLTMLIPSIMLGHLSQTVPEDILHFCMIGFAALFGVLAARKYTQPIKDDIGDKSVFAFNALPADEQSRVLKEQESDIE